MSEVEKLIDALKKASETFHKVGAGLRFQKMISSIPFTAGRPISSLLEHVRKNAMTNEAAEQICFDMFEELVLLMAAMGVPDVSVITCGPTSATVRCWRCKHEVPEETTVCIAGIGMECKDAKACRGRWYFDHSHPNEATVSRELFDDATSKLAIAINERDALRAQLESRSNDVAKTSCTRPPVGWYCTRGEGHDGPCAARPMSNREAYEKGLRTALYIVQELHTQAVRLGREACLRGAMAVRESALRLAAQHIEDAHITHPWQDEEDAR